MAELGKDGGDRRGSRGKEKRFGCSYCDRLFARKEHADRHERTHTQEKPFQCAQCDSRFTRSDLLVRHERLTHKKEVAEVEASEQERPNKRRRTLHAGDSASSVELSSTALMPVANNSFESFQDRPVQPMASSRDHDFLTTLSFAAEQAALQDSLLTVNTKVEDNLSEAPPPYGDMNGQRQPTGNSAFVFDASYPAPPQNHLSTNPRPVSGILLEDGPINLDFDGSQESLAAFLDHGELSSYHFASWISTEQPVPFFSPETLSYSGDTLPPEPNQISTLRRAQSPPRLEEQSSFSRFGSRLPSLQPEERPPPATVKPRRARALADVSIEDMQGIVDKVNLFPAISADFRVPSRLALSRYLAAYINGFHEHLPFLHTQTMTIKDCSIELILAMAAVGAQYCLEGDRGVELFRASQYIAAKRIRRRDTRLAGLRRGEPEWTSGRGSLAGSRIGSSDPSPHPSSPGGPIQEEDMMQTAQALLILMAMATWAKHKEILREALGIQSVLATLIREDGLKCPDFSSHCTWEEWVRIETIKRTKFIVFCFFNLHCIVYNIPPLILNAELKMTLPSTAAEFKALTADRWREAHNRAVSPTTFEEALGRLFSRGGREITEWNSSLGNYILIHAIIQHIFFVRQTAKCRFDGSGALQPEDVATLEQALRNWQLGWRRNPESSLDPMDPNGPVAFNSTALLRLAYIRLNVDTGPGRALDTRDPHQIAAAFADSPALKRTPKLVRAVLHSAHALSIPVKIGVRLVAQTQTFVWSIQHSLCSLECAFLLSKWLEALSLPFPEPAVTEDERRIAALVRTLLDETEFAVPRGLLLEAPGTLRQLSAGVLRVWATIFRGAQTWAIVDVIGTSLNIYADMLEA